ncbi:TRAP transporter small permease [[Clostridium] colinum]|uniref:TRAP transporter small permease n=1 Tax=[Clostridium] colinum TaxID=36835 RepID=UPI002023EFCD|nr:TRAP transporter small permease [[Clostridium] colinum]
MIQFRKTLDKILEIVCVLLFVFITIVGSYQIITRYVFNSPSTVSEELLIFSFTWLSLLASALVFGKKEHMRMSFLADKITGVKAIYLDIITEIIIFIFSAVVLVYGGIKITNLTMTQITASLGIVMGYIYIIIPITGALILIYNILNISESVYKLKSGGN